MGQNRIDKDGGSHAESYGVVRAMKTRTYEIQKIFKSKSVFFEMVDVSGSARGQAVSGKVVDGDCELIFEQEIKQMPHLAAVIQITVKEENSCFILFRQVKMGGQTVWAGHEKTEEMLDFGGAVEAVMVEVGRCLS